jgi:YesN/AraC family two-component response regulator
MARLARPHLHLVITDIVMPDLDGRQLVDRL